MITALMLVVTNLYVRKSKIKKETISDTTKPLQRDLMSLLTVTFLYILGNNPAHSRGFATR